MRGVIQNLQALFHLFCAQWIEKKRNDYGQRKADHKPEKAQKKGVCEIAPEIRVGKENTEIVKTDPDGIGADNRVALTVVLKGYKYSVHGRVAEYYNVYQRGKDKQKYPAPALEIRLPPIPFGGLVAVFGLVFFGAVKRLVSLFNKLFVFGGVCG